MRIIVCRLAKDIRNSNTGELIHPKGAFVGIDSSSGGYPWVPRNPFQAYHFPTRKDAEEYASHWPVGRVYAEKWEQLISYELEVAEYEVTFTEI